MELLIMWLLKHEAMMKIQFRWISTLWELCFMKLRHFNIHIKYLCMQILWRIEALIYIMHEDRELGCPTGRYFDACLEGYQRFGFDPRCLGRALTDSVDRKTAKRFLEQS